MSDDDVEKLAEEIMLEESRKKDLIRPIKGGVKATKEYVEEFRKKLNDMRLTTREDMDSFRETMSVLRDTVVAIKGSASKEDMESFRATMKSISETMVTVRDTVESVRKTTEAVREIMLIATMLKKSMPTEFANIRETEQPEVSQSEQDAGKIQESKEQVQVD